ncbi:MAG: hypothetical protein R3E68_02820 [Burkholderiaceae bacterium]
MLPLDDQTDLIVLKVLPRTLKVIYGQSTEILASQAFDAAGNPPARPAGSDIAKPSRPAPFARRDLPVLGITLGMPVAEAKKALLESLKDSSPVILDTAKYEYSLASAACVRETKAMRQELRNLESTLQQAAVNACREESESLSARHQCKRGDLSEGDQQVVADRKQALVAALSPECHPQAQTFQIVAGVEVEYADDLVDRIFIFSSPHPDHADKIVAISRVLRDKKQVVDFRTELAKRFGEVTFPVTPRKGEIVYWFETPEGHDRIIENAEFRESCSLGTPWPVDLQGSGINDRRFTAACGRYAAARDTDDDHRLLVIDTDYTHVIAEQRAASVRAVEEKKPAKVKF